jgi:hypothetical protein
MQIVTYLGGSGLGRLQDGSRGEPTHQPETDTRCDQGNKVPDVFRKRTVDRRFGPVREVGWLGGAIPDDEISARDPIAHPGSEVAKV